MIDWPTTSYEHEDNYRDHAIAGRVGRIHDLYNPIANTWETGVELIDGPVYRLNMASHAALAIKQTFSPSGN